jgi:predicted nuclease of predicted toxin-antitoxin system
MRLLLDECIPARLSRALVGHEVLTIGKAGWSGVKNGELLALAAAKFDAFVTVDKNLPYQQNSANLPVAVFVLDAHSNELHHLLLLVPRLEEALLSMRPRSYVLIKAAEA